MKKDKKRETKRGLGNYYTEIERARESRDIMLELTRRWRLCRGREKDVGLCATLAASARGNWQ